MYHYQIDRNEWLTPSTILLTLKKSETERKVFGYHPGQYAAIAFSSHGRPSVARCFSITSSPMEEDVLQFSIRVHGTFTSRLKDLEPGSAVSVRGPFGGFVLDSNKHHDVIFAAGGIGIAPFMSMLHHMYAVAFPHDIQLLYSVHDQSDIPFIDELKELERAMPNLHITYAVSQGDTGTLAGQTVVRGRIGAAELQTALGGQQANKTLFICGPQAFMTSLVKLAKIHGLPPSRIITEAFNQGDHLQTGKVVSWPRNMYIIGGLGVAVGSFAIMTSDIIKNLPSTPLADSAAVRSQLQAKNSRETDLDELIKHFASNLLDGREDSPATVQAMADAAVPVATSTPSVTTPTQKSTTLPSTNTTVSTSTPTPTVTAPAPAPKPTPVCTTSMSGVTTCQ